jgi:hypothetical protein
MTKNQQFQGRFFDWFFDVLEKHGYEAKHVLWLFKNWFGCVRGLKNFLTVCGLQVCSELW